MKRILSVILSLALLASLLIIPMSVSADEGGSSAPTVETVEFKNSQFSEKYSDTDNLSKGLVPYGLVTKPKSETDSTKVRVAITDDKEDIARLSNGTISEKTETGENLSNTDVNLPDFVFRKTGTDGYNGDYYNGYKPYDGTKETEFNFNKSASEYEAYVDIIYDLGSVASINKIQHFSMAGGLSAGAYSVYASEDVNTLFNSASWVLDYQNKTFVSGGSESDCQEHTLISPVSARFVAFRIYSVVTSTTGTSNSHFNVARIKELAIYGTKTADPNYTVKGITKYNSWTSDGGEWMDIPSGNLLSLDKLTINGKQDGADKGLKEFQIGPTQYHELLHDGKYGGHQNDRMHADVGIVVFHDGKNFRNGYDIQRDVDGNITFTQSGEINTYTCFTYNLQTRHKITEFMLYANNKGSYTGTDQMQAYEVYVGDNAETLYDSENKVAEYNNYFNVYGQEITFKNAPIGKYLGVKVLMAEARTATYNYPRIAEIAALGEEVGNDPVIDVAPGETCGSAVVTVTDVDGNLASVKVNGEEKVNDENKDSVKAKYEETINKGDYTVVATDDKGNVTTKEITVADHNYKYTAKDNVITETCANCERPAETLTLKVVDGPLVYDGSDKYASIIADPTEGFAGWHSAIDIEIDGKQAESVINAGNYVAKVKIGDATAVLPFTIEKAIPEYTAPEYKVGEAGNELSTIKLDDGFIWKNPTEKIKYSNGDKFEYDAIFTPADVDNYKIAELKIKVNGVDTIPPTGTIKIKETVWDKLANVVFGWFINEKETVTITGSDAGSGVDKILYYVTDAEVDNSALANVEWTDYTGSFKIEKEGNNVVYAKIFDKKGNSKTINTEGIVLDTIAPVADATDKGIYYGSLTVTVKDDNLDTVKLNGKDVTLDEEGRFVVDAADGAQKIVITDKAGNETTYTVTVVEVKGFNPADGKLTVDMDEKNVDNAGKEKIAEKIEKGETVTFFDISVDNATGSTANVLEIPVDFDFTGKLNVRVLHNHGGNVNELKALTARPTAGFENGTFFADKENGKLYIYSKEFSPFAVAFHVHDVKHVEAKAATAEADGNIEYWYCEGCDKCFSDAAATKEIQKADTVVKYVAPSNGNTGSGSNAPTTGGETENNATVPGGTSPVTGETAMTVVLFAILLGALAVMGISIVKSRKAKSK